MSADQSRPVSRVSVVEALTQIRALCDELDKRGATDLRLAAGMDIVIREVRAVLDAVSVDAPQCSELCRCGHPRTVHFKPGDPRGTCTRDASGVWPPVPCACPGYEPIDAVSVDATPAHESGSWVEGIRTRACEQGAHDRCDGTATLSGGRGQYACACGCHPRPVDATPPQGIDRDALMAILMEQWTAGPRETANRILELVNRGA